MNKRPNFFKKIGYSFVPTKYGILGIQSKGSVFGFVCLLSLILLIGNMANFYFMMKTVLREQMQVENFEQLINKYVPDFSITNGKLQLEQPIDFAVDKTVIYIDDNAEQITMSDVDYLVQNSAFEAFLLGSKNNMVVYMKEDGNYREMRFSDVGQFISNKQDIIDLVNNSMVIGTIFVGAVWYIGLVIVYFFKALVYFLVLELLNVFIRRRVRAGNVYATAVFALVPTTLVDFLITLMPVTIPNEILNPIYFVVTTVIGAFALFSVHEMAQKQTEEKFQYKFEDNPYRVSGFVPDDAAAIADENFGGYAAIAGGPKPSYSKANGANTKVRMKGVEVSYSELELINRYIKANLKDLAVEQLQEVSGLSKEDCEEVVGDWGRYYY